MAHRPTDPGFSPSQDPFDEAYTSPPTLPQDVRYSTLSADTSANTSLGAFTPSADSNRPFINSQPQFDSLLKSEYTAVDIPSSTDINPRRRRLPLILLASAVAIIVIVLAVILPVYFEVIKKHHSSSAIAPAGSSSGSTAPGAAPTSTPKSSNGATWGGNGSLITATGGTTFTYINNFGGYWVYDPRNPYNNSARAQSYTPPLDEPWDYANDHIQGVNLGGWLVLEPFIVPALFQKYQGVVDEWTLSIAMSNDTSPGGGLQQIEDHYATFITELDFAQIAGAGLNWIRLPLPFWAIETWPGEPFLAKACWKYALLAFQWARKYGLRIYLDLHTVPGSQNGYNHSGRTGVINFLNGPMGIANAQRTLDYIRIITEFVTQNDYTDVVQMWGVVNEPLISVIGRDPVSRFYLQAHDMIRGITGIGQGAYIVIHDGFMGTGSWAGFLPGSDRVALDTHPYVVFGVNMDQPVDYWPPFACNAYDTNTSQSAFGVTVSGEFSSAINDCGLWINGIGGEPRYNNCTPWNDYRTWTDEMKTGVKQFTMAQMDAMHVAGYFFWTWKIGNSSTSGIPEAPMWSYQLGLENGWIPADPRDAIGMCESLNIAQNQPFTGYQSWQTGGAGAGTIAPTAVASLSQYPPPAISNVNGADPLLLPFYTATSAVPTLPVPTYSGATASASDGWADPADTSLAMVQISGCSYPDAWSVTASQTAFACNIALQATQTGIPPAVTSNSRP
ncbi:glycoside hydrolase [Sparassis latifolia]